MEGDFKVGIPLWLDSVVSFYVEYSPSHSVSVYLWFSTDHKKAISSEKLFISLEWFNVFKRFIINNFIRWKIFRCDLRVATYGEESTFRTITGKSRQDKRTRGLQWISGRIANIDGKSFSRPWCALVKFVFTYTR